MRWLLAEVKSMVDILETEHATAEDAAKAALEEALAAIRKRESYIVLARVDGLTLLYGPWHDKRSAAKYASGVPGGAVLTVGSSGRLEELAKDPVDSRYCEGCTHPRAAHSSAPWVPWPGNKNKPGVARFPAGCMVSGCDCSETGAKRKGK